MSKRKSKFGNSVFLPPISCQCPCLMQRGKSLLSVLEQTFSRQNGITCFHSIYFYSYLLFMASHTLAIWQVECSSNIQFPFEIKKIHLRRKSLEKGAVYRNINNHVGGHTTEAQTKTVTQKWIWFGKCWFHPVLSLLRLEGRRTNGWAFCKVIQQARGRAGIKADLLPGLCLSVSRFSWWGFSRWSL